FAVRSPVSGVIIAVAEAKRGRPQMESRRECLDPNWRCCAPYRLWLRFPREDGDLLLLKPVRRATLPRHCRKSGECRITLSLPSSRSDIHDKSAPTECDPHFRP